MVLRFTSLEEFTLSNSFQTIQDFVNLDEVAPQSLCI